MAKKVKFYVASCSFGGRVKMDVLDEFTFSTKEAVRSHILACREADLCKCDAQIHGPFEIERKP